MKYVIAARVKKQYLQRLLVFLIAVLTISLTGCDDDNDSNNADDMEPEAGTAYFVGLFINTPTGRIWYLGAYEEIPASVNLSQMVELGSGFRLSPYGEHTYVWNGNAATLAKYGVENDLSIEVESIMSFASTGLAGDFGPPAFISDTQAYFFALNEGKIIDFNPEEMTITEIIDVAPLEFSPDPEARHVVWYSYISGDKIILPIGHYPAGSNVRSEAKVAVFDVTNKTVTYNTDSRASAGYDEFSTNNQGEYYYRPRFWEVYSRYYLDSPSPTGVMLSVREDGTFDPDFSVNLEEILNAKGIYDVSIVFDNQAVVSYFDSDWTPPNEFTQVFTQTRPTALVDLDNGTFEPFTAFDEIASGAIFPKGSDKDGNIYYMGRNTENVSYLVTLNSPTDYNIVASQNFDGGSWQLVHQVR